MAKRDWVGVDLDGLLKLIDERGKSFAIYELVQNAWDTDAKNVHVRLEKSGRDVWVEVEDDDPEGFRFMDHAFTLFAESIKKDDPTKRGRFNLGEKLVLALCKEAEINTTKGTIYFNEDGTRTEKKTKEFKREKGSVFSAKIPIKREEYDEILEGIERLLPPKGIKTTVQIDGSSEVLVRPEPVASFEVVLPTMRADKQGNMKRTNRKTRVDVFEPVNDSEEGWIYEMGIPVVETGDAYLVDIQQKVPLNMDRDNVTPSYLQKVRTEVLNATYDILDEEDARETWVNDALDSDDVSDEAVEAAITARYGKKRAIFDPNDLEANNRLVADGYTLIKGRELSKKAWGNVRSSGAAIPAGKLRPTPSLKFSPDGEPMDVLNPNEWTTGMARVYGLTRQISEQVMGFAVDVDFVRVPRSKGGNFLATYGNRKINFNISTLGKKWFGEKFTMTKFLDLLIHEMAHEYSDNHLSSDYYDGLSRLGAKIAVLALESPETFEVDEDELKAAFA